jgi:hypothetical protein
MVDYVFVDEHNRHKRLKGMKTYAHFMVNVMNFNLILPVERACKDCRRMKIKCDAVTTNTWPCSACIRMKLHCVRPDYYDGVNNTTMSDALLCTVGQFQGAALERRLSQDTTKRTTPAYASPSACSDVGSTIYQSVAHDPKQPQLDAHSMSVMLPVSIMNPSYAQSSVFSTPSMPMLRPDEPSPATYSSEFYHQLDLTGLGSFEINERGTSTSPFISIYFSGMLILLSSILYKKQGVIQN